jgi:Ca-activated chloride channel family protein
VTPFSRAAVALSLGALTLADLSARQQPVFRAAAEAVTVGVSVRRGGRPVSDLTTADFEITDNGVPQTVSALSYEKLPVDTTILFDVSGSVAGSVMTRLRRAVTDFRASLRPGDRVRLVAFNMRVRQLFDLDATPAAADAAFASLVPGGSSAISDALAVALASGTDRDRRHFIVMFSDGKDSASITRPEVLLDVARRTTPTVSIVLATPARQWSDSLYADLAAETGGTLVSLLPTDTLGGSLRSALDAFRSSYVLTYSPAGVPASGAHAIDVKVKRSGVEVRARRGYVVK